MCGICGKVNFDLRPVHLQALRKMAAVLRHRGPDDEGFYLKGNVGLGHRRLKIIDLSRAAGQPMCNEDSSIWIIFNGEIYNFQDLRKDLEQKGHIFRSRSDTEAIIHLYEEKGVDCVKELRGMFAFAIFDENKKRLFLARDRIGKKPLFYAINNKALIFASEIKSILQDSSIASSRGINLHALDLYLTYQYIPFPETIFSEIKKLPPAHMLILEEGKVRIQRYWQISFQNRIKLSEEEYCERTLDILAEACRIRMVSDVPLGAFLSGGIDSSAVVAMMSKFSAKPVKTFSIGFKEESFNELEYARKVAKFFHTEHHEYMVNPDALEILPKLIWHFDEPFADSSAIPTYYISKITRQEVTVALNGDGGDESFAGYERYAGLKLADIYGFLPGFMRKGIAYLAQGLQESTQKRDFSRRFKRFVRAGCLSREERYAYWMSAFDSEQKRSLYSQDFKNRLGVVDSGEYIRSAYRQLDTKDFIAKTLFVDVSTYLPNDLLVKVDIASMANSLEARSPFLDHKLMEFAASIPSDLKLKGLTTKYVLKKALKGILPQEILHRSKSGFGVPVGDWFRDELKDYARDILLSLKSLKRGYFQKGAVKRLLDEHALGRVDHGQRIWSLINLELWHQIFIDNR